MSSVTTNEEQQISVAFEKATATTSFFQTETTTIIFIRNLIGRKPIRLYDPTTKVYDYMGQILMNLKQPVLFQRKPIVFPSENNIPLPPFTRFVRGRLVDTDLVYNIMNLSSGLASESRLTNLLTEIGYKVHFDGSYNF